MYIFDEIAIDVTDNEKEVIEYLNSKNIFERGEICSPTKDIWFKTYHYIQIVDLYSQPLFYHYINKNKKYQSKDIIIISFNEFKEVLNGRKYK